jgi:hypothetical protein
VGYCPAYAGRGPAVICLIPTPGMAAPGLPGMTPLCRHRCDETGSFALARDPAHSPCSRSHAHPAGPVATTAGGLLPHRFAPCSHPRARAGILSVVVVVRTRLSPACPHLLFREATLHRPVMGQVPGVGKFLWPEPGRPATAHPSTTRIISWEGTGVKGLAAPCPLSGGV